MYSRSKHRLLPSRRSPSRRPRYPKHLNPCCQQLPEVSIMSAQTGAGIQELMAAETRASQIVAEARMGKQLIAV